MNQDLVTLLTEENEPEEWTKKRLQLEEQIAQFTNQEQNIEEESEDQSDMTDSSESPEDPEKIEETE